MAVVWPGRASNEMPCRTGLLGARIPEIDVAELDDAGSCAVDQPQRLRRIVDRGRGVEHLADPAGGHRRAGHQDEHEHRGEHREQDLEQVLQEGGQRRRSGSSPAGRAWRRPTSPRPLERFRIAVIVGIVMANRRVTLSDVSEQVAVRLVEARLLVLGPARTPG